MPPRNSDELLIQIVTELRKEVGELNVKVGVLQNQISMASSSGKGIMSVFGSVVGGMVIVGLAKLFHWN